MAIAENPTEKSISSAFAHLWMGLSHNQQRFAIVMLECSTKTEAAEVVGIKPNTVYGWPKEVDTAIDMLRNQSIAATLGIIEANANKAAAIKAGGLDSDNEKIRQDSATEILDRVLGRATQRQEVTGADGGPIYVVNWDDPNDTD